MHNQNHQPATGKLMKGLPLELPLPRGWKMLLTKMDSSKGSGYCGMALRMLSLRFLKIVKALPRKLLMICKLLCKSIMLITVESFWRGFIRLLPEMSAQMALIVQQQ
uniref:Uncharacterized protein n=1 Tax=Arundo donax TaxID=35708 RepID=A0A0A9D0J3_ARUDO